MPITWILTREVRFLDGNIGNLMQALKNQNLYDQSMIILLADHGEEFFEHGVSGHGDNLTQETVHIPLIIKFPGGAHAGTVVEDNVSLVDIAPTVMHIAGLPVPSAMQGIVLSPQGQPDRNIFAEVGDDDNYMRSIMTPEWRLIKRLNRNRNTSTVPDLALFNRRTDPMDLEEVSSRHPDVVTSLLGLMDDHFHRSLAESLPREAAEMSPEVQDRMNTLGYLR